MPKPQKAKLPKKPREIIGLGAHSYVLADSHHQVLLVTRVSAAQKLLQIAQKLPLAKAKRHGIDIPCKISENEDLASLILPENPDAIRKTYKAQALFTNDHIWNKNVVFTLPRFMGTLENLTTLRYKEKSLQDLEKTLTKALHYLHRHNITHNDLASKNIFYSGEFPHLNFHLGDFGAVSFNTNQAIHQEKVAQDFSKLRAIINNARTILQQKYAKTYLSDYQRIKNGISPLKPITKSKLTTSSRIHTRGKKLFP